MQIDTEAFRILPGAAVDLAAHPTRVPPPYRSKKHYRELIDAHTEALAAQQELLYANNTHSLLVIFQAMDAAGKDSAIKHVMSGVNPQGCQVYSFKHPSTTELAHDFLWRTTRCLPERGQIGIFNRSYYEEVLIVRVLPEILKAQDLPREALKAADFWPQRYRSINELEAHLHRNGTRILKFFLHVSKEEQRERLLKRIDEPDKRWKFQAGDLEQRKHWDAYQSAYAQCLAATSTAEAPWYAMPADDKRTTHLLVSQVILEALQGLRLAYPKADAARKRELRALRKQLAG